MTIDQLITKYQDRSAEYTRRAAPYALKDERTARNWLGRAVECDEIVRDLQALKETPDAVQRVRAKARSDRRDSEAGSDQAPGAEGFGGSGSPVASDEE